MLAGTAACTVLITLQVINHRRDKAKGLVADLGVVLDKTEVPEIAVN